MYWIFTVFCLLGATFGSSLPRKPVRIVGGTDAGINDAPYQVSLQLDYALTGTFEHTCGGTILNSRAILSAAHCGVNTSPMQWKVRAGSSMWATGGQLVNVKKIITHEMYNATLGGKDYDIALFMLDEPLTAGAPVIFPKKDYLIEDGANGLLTGWGASRNGGPSKDMLQKATFPIVNQDICKEKFSGIEIVNDQLICAGAMEIGSQDACQGDTGGPLTIDGVIVGITLWGRGCGETELPRLFTKVPSYIDWIVEQTSI